MSLSDSELDASSRTMKNVTLVTDDNKQTTKEFELEGTVKTLSKNDAYIIEKKETDSENNVSIVQDGEKASWFQKIIEFLEVKYDSTDSVNHKPKKSIRTLKELRESLRTTYLYNTDLRPVEAKRRTWTWKQYIFFWISGSFNVNTWQISATGLQLGLNWWQTWICIWAVSYTHLDVYKRQEPDVCIIELGGTVGDIESAPFVEALRQFQFKVGKENFALIHVSLVPVIHGEQKTKPTQAAIKGLRSLGLVPDMIACRCSETLDKPTIDKIAMFCHVGPEQVVNVHDVNSTYHVPLLLLEQKMIDYLHARLKLEEISLTEEERERGLELLSKWKATTCLLYTSRCV